jgi:hypothetical protein
MAGNGYTNKFQGFSSVPPVRIMGQYYKRNGTFSKLTIIIYSGLFYDALSVLLPD